MFTLSAQLQKVAKENCNEYIGAQRQSLMSLKVWLKQTSHIKSPPKDELLLSFLRRCRYNLYDTKKRIIDFYSMKNVFPEVLSHRVMDPRLMELYYQGVHTILLKPLANAGPRIIISQYNKYDYKKSKPADVFKLLFMLVEVLANEDPHTSVAGVLCIVDARDVTLDQAQQCDRKLLKKTWTFIESCLPAHFRAIHVINLRKEVRAEFNFIKSFLRAKMPPQILVHEKAEDLYQHLPRDALTVEYGGHNGYQREALSYWEAALLKYKDYFLEQDQNGDAEPFQSITAKYLEFAELTGVRGSFRKLDEN